MDSQNMHSASSALNPTRPQKFCKHCGERIDVDCVVCPKCGKQVEQLKSEAPQVIVNNSNVSTNTNVNTNVNRGYRYNYRHKSKMTALLLAIFFGYAGIHRFYVGKIGTGLIWLFTGGLCFFGWIFDVITILTGSFRDKNGMSLR